MSYTRGAILISIEYYYSENIPGCCHCGCCCCCCAAAVLLLLLLLLCVLVLLSASPSSYSLALLLLRTVTVEAAVDASTAAAAAVVAADAVAVAAAPLSLQLSLSFSFDVHAVRTFLTSRASRASRPRASAPCSSFVHSQHPCASLFRALCLRDPSFVVSSNAFVRCRLLGGRALSRPSLAVPYHRLLPHRSSVAPPSGATIKTPGCQVGFCHLSASGVIARYLGDWWPPLGQSLTHT